MTANLTPRTFAQTACYGWSISWMELRKRPTRRLAKKVSSSKHRQHEKRELRSYLKELQQKE